MWYTVSLTIDPVEHLSYLAIHDAEGNFLGRSKPHPIPNGSNTITGIMMNAITWSPLRNTFYLGPVVLRDGI